MTTLNSLQLAAASDKFARLGRRLLLAHRRLVECGLNPIHEFWLLGWRRAVDKVHDELTCE